MNKIRTHILTLLLIIFSSKSFAEYTAVMSCEFNNAHTNIYVCFMGDYVETEIELRNYGSVNIYKAYQLQSLGYETYEGFEFTLSDTFHLIAQNASDLMILRLRIYDSGYNLVYEDVASQYGVINVQN